MFNFFTSFWDALSTLWQMLMNFFSGIIVMFQVVIASLSLPQYFIMLVPSFIGASVLIVLSIGVVKLILGWGNS